MPRTCSLTAERRTKIERALAAGATVGVAAEGAGVSARTVSRWLGEGRIVRRVLAEADAEPLPDPPGADELLRLLGERARHGSVRAIELLLTRKWERRTSEPQPPVQAVPDDPFAEADRLREQNLRRLRAR